jgi:hypothetical protein
MSATPATRRGFASDAADDFRGTSRFVLRRRVGVGGGGVVYEAEDVVEREVVALKTLRTLDAGSLLRLKHEFRALQGVHHPNLVTLGELLEDNGRWFFTMEYVPGRSFLEHVWSLSDDPAADFTPHTLATPTSGDAPPDDAPHRPRPSLDHPRLRDALRQLCLGVSALHGVGIVHRDIKPENVRVTPEGRVVVLDFGLATAARADTATGEIVGTVHYMAPEQADGRPIGPAADWYAVGVVLYEALTGELPYDGLRVAVLCAKQRAATMAPPRLPDDVPDDLRSLCLALLHVDPALRPDDAAVLRCVGAAPTAPTTPGEVHLVGRDAELSVLRETFEATGGGDAWAVVIQGRSGVGKSALLQAFIEGVLRDDASCVALRGKCYERESVPHKALDSVVDALSRHLRALPYREVLALAPPGVERLARVFPTLGRLTWGDASEAPPTDDPHELRRQAFAVLRELLVRVCERRRVVVVIDDMQWSDADSRDALHDLLAPPRAPRLLLILAARDDAGFALELPCPTRRIDLAPLDAPFAVALARDLLARAPLTDDARATIDPHVIAREAGGHPLFLGELVRHACAVGRAPGEEPVSLDDALHARVERLGHDARAALELIAVAEARTPRDVIRSAADVSRGAFQLALEGLRTAALIRTTGPRASDDVEPYHDRVRESVLARLPADRAVAHHRRIAHALDAAGVGVTHPERLARHFEAAGEAVRAAEFARAAGAKAMTALAFDQAATFFTAALALGAPAGDARRALEHALAEALNGAGRGPEAADAYLAAAVDAPDAQRLDCRRLAAEQLLWSGHITRGLAALDVVLGEIGLALPTSRVRALASLVWQRARLLARGVDWTPQPLDAIPPRTLVQIDICQNAASGLMLVDPVASFAMQTRGLILALDAGEYHRVVQALLQEAVARASGGRPWLDEALRRTAEVEHLPGPTGAPSPAMAASARTYGGVACVLGGQFATGFERLREIEASSDAGLREARTLGARRGLMDTGLLFRLWALLHLGRFVALREHVTALRRDAVRRGDRFLEVSLARACHAAELADDRPEAARRALDHASAVWSSPTRGLQLQEVLDVLAHIECDLYEGVAGAGDDRADALFRRFERSLVAPVQLVRAMVRGLRGRLYLARVEVGRERGRWLDEAARMAGRLEGERVTYATAWAALLRAGIAAQRGARADAIRALREAVAVATEAELTGVAAAAHHRLGALLPGAEGRSHVAEAQAWATREAVANPARMFALLAPGFEGAGG